MALSIVLASYLVCAVAFFFLATLVLLSKSGGRQKHYLFAACSTTAIWAAAAAGTQWLNVSPLMFGILELVRNIAWLLFAASLLSNQTQAVSHRTWQYAIIGACAFTTLATLGALFASPLGLPLQMAALFEQLMQASRVLLTVLGLLILENILRNADPANRWGMKYVCFGAGTIFAYDFFLYADSILFQGIDQSFFEARGFVNAIVVPLLAVGVTRADSWNVNIHVSRNAVFHSAALLSSGLYLLGMSAAGYYLREFGGEWGRILQIVFLTSAIVILFILFMSAAVRARVRVWISKHFFNYKYDYRQEWLRFIHTISAGDNRTDLHQRIVLAVADIVDCGAGALWILNRDDRAYLPTANWNLAERLPAIPIDSGVPEFFSDTDWVLDLTEYAAGSSKYEGLDLPDWLLENKRAWLVVPLAHRNVLSAILVLGSPRVRKDLMWEDFDLLKTVAHQSASYLAEEQAQHELSDARRLEAFNRRSAFIVHDIKNVVSQMSLMMKNAEKYGDNPEFQKDMLNTVANSVARMKTLLEQFKVEHAIDETGDQQNLGAVLSQIAHKWQKQKSDLVFTPDPSGCNVPIDRERMESVLNHLLQNAIEAAGPDGKVSVRNQNSAGECRIEVEDNGPGMDEAFIRERLFRPLETKKSSGYGLGAFQTRELVREMNGRLEVESKVGQGTIMRVVLQSSTNSDEQTLKTARTHTE